MKVGDRVQVSGIAAAHHMRGKQGVVERVFKAAGSDLYGVSMDNGRYFHAHKDELSVIKEGVNMKKDNGEAREPAIKIDPSTGLPELPEGHRWRVSDEIRETSIDFPTIYVKSKYALRVILEIQVREDGTELVDNPDWRWWNMESRTIAMPVTRTAWKTLHEAETSNISADGVLSMAENLFDRLDRDIKRDAARQALVGVYPPKKLEVAA